MTHPDVMIRRASAIMDACGGTPDRITLAHPTPAVECAWTAYQVGWHLMFTRKRLAFLSTRGGPDVESLKSKYKAYRNDQQRARLHVRMAGDALVKAETAFAALRKVMA